MPNWSITSEDVSIDHMIDDAAFEPQRTNHSYIYFDLSDITTDIHGDRLQFRTASSLAGGKDDNTYPASKLLRLALTSHGMPQQGSDSVVQVRKGNEVIKFASGVSYEDINISVTDWLGADMEMLISAWDALRYNPVTGFINPAVMYKKTGTIVQYSPDGNIIRSWTLKGAWIDNVDYGDYDRSSSGDAREISFTLHIDKAYPEVRDTGTVTI